MDAVGQKFSSVGNAAQHPEVIGAAFEQGASNLLGPEGYSLTEKLLSLHYPEVIQEYLRARATTAHPFEPR